MDTSAIIVMCLALLVTWGGVSYCISVALKNKKK